MDTEIIALINQIGESTSQELKTYAFVQWVYSTAFFAIFFPIAGAIWFFRHKIIEKFDIEGDPFVFYISFGALFAIITLVFILVYPTYTIDTFLFPEITAIKSIIFR